MSVLVVALAASTLTACVRESDTFAEVTNKTRQPLVLVQVDHHTGKVISRSPIKAGGFFSVPLSFRSDETSLWHVKTRDGVLVRTFRRLCVTDSPTIRPSALAAATG